MDAVLNFGNGIIANIIANLVFWLGLGLVYRYIILNSSQSAFLDFFGVKDKRSITVYLSNLWLPQVHAHREWATMVSGYEFEIIKTIGNLFGAAPFSVPEIVRGLIDALWIGRNITWGVEVSPLQTDLVNFSATIIAIGTTTKNSVRRYYANNNMLHVTISGEPQTPPEDTTQNALGDHFEIMKGAGRGFLNKHPEEKCNIAIIEKIFDPEKQITVFMCAGKRGDDSLHAMEYLARNWKELYEQFGDKPFAMCLWFPYDAEPVREYRNPKDSTYIHTG